MKKLIFGLTALALASATVPTARAGDCGWATAGKVLTGVFAGVAIARAFEPPVYYAPPAVYAYPPPAPGITFTWRSAPGPVGCVVTPPIVLPAPLLRPPVCPRPVVVCGPRVYAHGHHYHNRPVCH